jgi:hypothetical protein
MQPSKYGHPGVFPARCYYHDGNCALSFAPPQADIWQERSFIRRAENI